MKRFLVVALAASMGLVVAGAASAALPSIADYPGGAAANGIANSRHNLGAYGKHIITGSTTEVCIFCHTPHHTNTTGGLKPLWNRGNATTSFSAYGTTIANTSITTVGSVSLACLSCHDGQTTFDNIVNAPGKDGVSMIGLSRGWTFSEDGVTKSGFLTSKRLNIGNLVTGGYNGTTAGLSDDHPMSVEYSDGNAGTSKKASLRDRATTIAGLDLTAGLTSTDDNIEQNRWAVGGFIIPDNSTLTIEALLRLDGGVKKVECSSCHDPHFKNMSYGANTTEQATIIGTWGTPGDTAQEIIDGGEMDGLFLRRVGGNSGSGVCRTCHNK